MDDLEKQLVSEDYAAASRASEEIVRRILNGQPTKDALVLEGLLVCEWEETFVGGVEMHDAIVQKWSDEAALGANPENRHRYRITIERLMIAALFCGLFYGAFVLSAVQEMERIRRRERVVEEIEAILASSCDCLGTCDPCACHESDRSTYWPKGHIEA